MPQRPRVLHVVAFTPFSPALPATTLADNLKSQWFDIQAGQHRFVLHGGQLQFTLCVGDLQTMLREQQFETDAICLAPNLGWNRWSLKALARCCRRGATVWAESQLADEAAASLQNDLRQAGFVAASPQANTWRFDPPWALKTSRQSLRTQAAAIADCAIIGAGLAGASVAAALGRRGWQVQVLDAGASPAAGASGLPAGLLAPHVSADDSPRSRLTRAGLRLTRAQAQALLREGDDWQGSGVLERRLHAGSNIPELWHAQGAWMKPQALVQAWLQLGGVNFVGQTRVHALRRAQGQWQLLNEQGQLLAQASQVVLANAIDAPRLLRTLPEAEALLAKLPPLHGMCGLLSCGLRQAVAEANSDALPSYPVNGLGSLIPAVPTDAGLAWYAGATYESAESPPAPEAAQHQANLDKLRTLLPAAAAVLAPAFATGKVQGWRQTRCVSVDRLPLVGPLEDGPRPTLWISAAMGSRGLSLATLCAELLAARLGAEPWPVEASLARMLQANR